MNNILKTTYAISIEFATSYINIVVYIFNDFLNKVKNDICNKHSSINAVNEIVTNDIKMTKMLTTTNAGACLQGLTSLNQFVGVPAPAVGLVLAPLVAARRRLAGGRIDGRRHERRGRRRRRGWGLAPARRGVRGGVLRVGQLLLDLQLKLLDLLLQLLLLLQDLLDAQLELRVLLLPAARVGCRHGG
jgi:hypothetical protein